MWNPAEYLAGTLRGLDQFDQRERVAPRSLKDTSHRSPRALLENFAELNTHDAQMVADPVMMDLQRLHCPLPC